MNSFEKQIRILFDLQATQSGSSKKRGVGNYSSSLFSSISQMCLPQNIYTLISDEFSDIDMFKELSLDFSHTLRLPKFPLWKSERNYLGGYRDSMDGIAYCAAIHSLNPDVIYVSHIFEGFQERIAIPNPKLKAPGQIFCTTLYDLIPLRFKEHYFANTEFKRWYLSRANLLHQFDLIFSISESSRQDAIELLGIDPSRIVTIHGSHEKSFKPPVNFKETQKRLKKKYPLKEKMVLYSAGDEYRKNIKGAIEGFALVSKKIRKDTVLFVVCQMGPDRQEFYSKMATDLNLEPHEICFTGFIPEEDLVDFYRACDVFIYPSHYEGLGLPVLEAMACGAPVIGGNNSSIRELICLENALFDSWSSDAIAAALTKTLKNKDFTNTLRKHGLEQAKKYSWKRSANLALEAIQEAVHQRKSVGVQSVLNGGVSRKRLAMLTPIPPSQSGIAHYNAEFLPYLSRYFEIDLYIQNHESSDENLLSIFPIFNIGEFEKVASLYDVILYEFGNSEFHSHMLSLLKKFPGVVGLHDGYLSGLFHYNHSEDGYAKELLKAHGSLARKYLAPVQKDPNAVYNTIINLPCTKDVLDHAIGVISHSPFNLELARSYYKEGWCAPSRVIPQLAHVVKKFIPERLLQIREELKFESDAFIITTFGHINWTKRSDSVLEAFLSSELFQKSNAYLIFAGEPSEDEFCVQLSKRIKGSSIKDRIRITGYLSDEDYEKYLQITDLAIQLRKNHRGGTPRGVLDCLTHSVPVILNNNGSYTDYPDNVVIKLSPTPAPSEITQIFEHFFTNQNLLVDYAKKGCAYIQKYNDPNQCAAMYAAAIHEFTKRYKQMNRNDWKSSFAPYIEACANPENTSKSIASWLESVPTLKYKRARIFIDVSHITIFDFGAGVQRVVKEVVRALYCGNCIGFEPVAVRRTQEHLFVAKDFLQTQNLLLPCEMNSSNDEPIEFQAGDVFLMLDSSWYEYPKFYPIFEKARKALVPIFTVIYDLLPITLPREYVVGGGRKWFKEWIEKAVSSSNGLITISKSEKTKIAQYLKKQKLNRPNLTLDYFHLGSQFIKNEKKQTPRDVIQTPYLLMVGSIAPHKSHKLALDAMEKLWKKGVKLNLCIAGKEGWLAKDLMKRLRSHSKQKKKLFFCEKPSDQDIRSLYENAAGLLSLSTNEGFGLPLIEAAEHGLAILCSDIEVFREVAGDYATYVTLGNAQDVAKQIENWWHKYQVNDLPNTKEMPRLNWEESAQNLIKIMVK